MQPAATDHPRIHRVGEVARWGRGQTQAVQPGRGTQRDGRRQLHPPDAGELLHVLLLQPAVAADRDLPLHPLQRGVLEGRGQVLHVAELPGGARTGDHEQPRRLEVAGQRGVRAAHQHRGPHHRDVQTRMRTGSPAGEVLDLQQIAHAGGLGRGPQLGVLGEGDVVVGQRPVDHRRRAEHDPADPDGRRRREHGLGSAHVVGGAGRRVGLQVEVDGEMHDDVGTPQLLRDGRIADVEDVPVCFGRVAAPLVDGHDLLDLLRGREPARQQGADPRGGTRDGDHRPVRGRGRVGSRCANFWVWGTHRASPAVVCSTYEHLRIRIRCGPSCRRYRDSEAPSPQPGRSVYAGLCCRAVAVGPGPAARGAEETRE